MSVNDYIHTIAGTFILVSLALGVWVHPYWFFSPPLWGPIYSSMALPRSAQWVLF